MKRQLVRAVLEGPDRLARSYHVAKAPLPIAMTAAAVDIGTRFTGTEEPSAHDLVGAVDLTPGGALARAVGETVERYGLAPPEREMLEHLDGTADDLVARGEPLLDPDHWPGHPHPAPGQRARWYHSSERSAGPALWVPASVVDWPCAGSDHLDGWSGTPSGAAAHVSIEEATGAALAEVLERDALMVAWHRVDRNGAVRLEFDSLCAADGRFSRLTRAAPDLSFGVVRLPSVLEGAHGYLAWVSDGRRLGAGAGFHTREVDGSFTALREAWQLFGYLKGWEPAADRPVSSGFVQYAELRAAYWSDGRGAVEFGEWLAALAVEPARDDSAAECAIDLRAELETLGHEVVVVDLSPRLPDALQQEGFRVVKTIVRGLQPLILLDDRPWSLHPTRIPSAIRRPAGPHPLI